MNELEMTDFRRYILTAAHCIHGVPKDRITIVLGEHDRNDTEESQVQYRKIASFERHPDFQRSTFNNDIAVLRMDKPIRFNRYISPACLPIDYGKYSCITYILHPMKF